MPTGIYDRAASAWTPPPRKVDPPELIERIKTLYGAGHTLVEVADLVETTVKVLTRVMDRNGITRRTAAKRRQTGVDNHMWRGSKARYKALHLRVAVARGKPSQCEGCGTCDPATRYEWANQTGHYEDVSDYARLCVTCHRRLDARRRATTGRRTMPSPGGNSDV